MKTFILLLFLSILHYACNSNKASDDQNNATTAANNNVVVADVRTDSANFTSIQWLDSVDQDLRKVKEGQVVEISWKFKNTGDKPLVIQNVSASCGCTVAEKPEQPISPGKEGTIKAKFDSKGRSGMEHKNVYVVANSKGLQDHQLSFRLQVEKQ